MRCPPSKKPKSTAERIGIHTRSRYPRATECRRGILPREDEADGSCFYNPTATGDIGLTRSVPGFAAMAFPNEIWERGIWERGRPSLLVPREDSPHFAEPGAVGCGARSAAAPKKAASFVDAARGFEVNSIRGKRSFSGTRFALARPVASRRGTLFFPCSHRRGSRRCALLLPSPRRGGALR